MGLRVQTGMRYRCTQYNVHICVAHMHVQAGSTPRSKDGTGWHPNLEHNVRIHVSIQDMYMY